MSGSVIGGVAGAVIGFFVGGPSGARWGWVIGSTVGGIIAPPTIEAPDIGDAQTQTVQTGLPRPIVLGHPAPFKGNVIDGEKIARKVTVKTHQGKGGQTVKSKKFLLTSAIGVCEGPAQFVRIKRDGVVVLDRRTVFPAGWEGYSKEVKAAQKKFLESARLYEGTEDQLPDPALEAIHGVGNTPYFRGTCYIVDVDVDRTATRGTVAVYEFEMASCATINSEDTDLISQVADFYFPMIAGGSSSDDVIGTLPDLVYQNDFTATGNGVTYNDLNAFAEVFTGSGALDGSTTYTIGARFRVNSVSMVPGDMRLIAGNFNNYLLGRCGWALFLGGPNKLTPMAILGNGGGAGVTLAADFEVALGRTYHMAVKRNGSSASLVVNNAVVDTYSGAIPNFSGTGHLMSGGYGLTSYGGQMTISHIWGSTTALTEAQITQISYSLGVLPDNVYEIPDAEGSYIDPDTGEVFTSGIAHTTADICDVTLEEINEVIFQRCNVPTAHYDLSALSTIVVPGFLIASQAAGKDILSPLMFAYFYDLPEPDNHILARLRGGPICFTLTEDLMLRDGADEMIVRPQALEFPGKVTVITQEPDADYSPIPQVSQRYSPDVNASGEVTVSLAIPLGADDAMQIARKVHKSLWSQAEAEATFMLGPDFATMIASDPVLFDNRRWLVTKIDNADGALKVEARYERATNYESNATGVAPEPPTPPSGTVLGPTIFVAMNLPALRTQDQGIPGVYFGVQGLFTGWPGADIYMTTEAGVTTLVAEATQASIMGRVVEDEPSGGEPLTVRLWQSTDELENATTDQVAQGVNAAALITADDQAEIIGFEDALQETDGDWELSTITRGALGTTEVPRVVDDRFVMLELVQFLPIDIDLAGQTIIFTAVTKGTAFENNAQVSLVYSPLTEVVIDGGDLDP